MNFSFKIDYSIIFVFAALVISFLISYFYYKKSKLENFQRKTFTLLRFLSIFFILLLLFSPVISYISKIKEDPINVFLIDNSESLLLEKRDEKLKEVLKNNLRDVLPKNSENKFFLFSENLYKEIDDNEIETFKYEGINNFETNLSSTLYSLQERISNKNLSAITIVSDGIINEGGNPINVVRSLNIPTNYVLIGDTTQKNDLVLKNIFYNKTAFIESNVPIRLEINSYNYERNIKVNLYEEDKLIDTKELNVIKSQNLYSLSFNVISNVEAVIKYKVEITGLEDEITFKNNTEEFFIKFINNKFKVLVLAGGPSADLAFLSQEIKKIKNFEAIILTQKSPTEFYEGTLPDLNDFDSYIFIGFPTSITNQNILNEIKDKLEKNNSSLIFFASRNVDYKKLSILENKLPFKPLSISESEEETGIKTVSSLNKEIFRNSNLLSSINSFPNVFKTSSTFLINPSSETFLLTSKNSEPALVIENTEKNKSAAILVYGLYKWKLNNQNNNSAEVLNYILTSSLVAITDKEEKRKFNIETTRPVYSKYENVKFKAQITNFELQGGESIKVKIKGNSFNIELNLVKKNNKYYEGEVKIPIDGNYEYTAELYSKNLMVESIQNRFAIGENNYEYKLTRADNTILSSLSNETNGNNFTNKSLSDIKDFLNGANEKSVVEYRSLQNFELNINPYYLAAVILLLCLEWFLRKRNNLP